MQPYAYRQLTICTTHQLLRFYHAFDLLIVDEVDAFPYAMEPGLHYATQQALKPTGGLLLMTATPTRVCCVRSARKIINQLPALALPRPFTAANPSGVGLELAQAGPAGSFASGGLELD